MSVLTRLINHHHWLILEVLALRLQSWRTNNSWVHRWLVTYRGLMPSQVSTPSVQKRHCGGRFTSTVWRQWEGQDCYASSQNPSYCYPCFDPVQESSTSWRHDISGSANDGNIESSYTMWCPEPPSIQFRRLWKFELIMAHNSVTRFRIWQGWAIGRRQLHWKTPLQGRPGPIWLEYPRGCSYVNFIFPALSSHTMSQVSTLT